MSELKLNKSSSKWYKAFPNLTYPFNPFQNVKPLYYIQQGNALFIKVDKKTYIIEINQEGKK